MMNKFYLKFVQSRQLTLVNINKPVCTLFYFFIVLNYNIYVFHFIIIWLWHVYLIEMFINSWFNLKTLCNCKSKTHSVCKNQYMTWFVRYRINWSETGLVCNSIFSYFTKLKFDSSGQGIGQFYRSYEAF